MKGNKDFFNLEGWGDFKDNQREAIVAAISSYNNGRQF